MKIKLRKGSTTGKQYRYSTVSPTRVVSLPGIFEMAAVRERSCGGKTTTKTDAGLLESRHCKTFGWESSGYREGASARRSTGYAKPIHGVQEDGSSGRSTRRRLRSGVWMAAFSSCKKTRRKRIRKR